ncbi:arabinan endo-1,5-alpha-L-arabinosidase [Dysgonomonas sp. PFB1-18]|uniref:arabinan endo-1,5-alpha-L-arabinosidase n=1 Tax=unclassified Dysgonomonas TaxID=2630389 RepID=UPI002474AC57|nr:MULTISPECIES: arabinan endo-1,5-alpha-L-arabinosidase [unclassified Dysgonomonas]MDH6308384.1 arabinan endo-1,5-alpha-L-arabinosidase [Dysgonomonas sp. PF1-14]MDH6338179.1 arabinan endo-1,5-alpha-L-arabinosidase [Dysgonomonas sp. PF1-16]MDH6379676.1 arabinan endo-1,5-alpha-L-arabinosidase [Dysgonomonas sp. PFB1-18]MDH6397235.1 arabinan endo-1,5-alpha-L-arabinosidase [Dysgonomonas sp. PF1-23]
MKTIFHTLLTGCIATLISCSQKPFEPVQSENAWADDYRAVSEMKDYQQWGTYNVHDPSCLLVGDTYYMYSTDAIYKEDSTAIKNDSLPFGYIQMRKSKDLVNWEFAGWVFSEIPKEAKDWVLEQSGGVGATNMWAPYIQAYKGKYRLYYSVSAFAKQTSYIGMAESDSPEGPWVLKGCVVKTKTGDVMNAIDPSIVTNPENGEQWMHYGSYFGGLHCVQLNPETGLALKDGDQGHLTARRFDGRKNNIEAPEIIYNPDLKQYFLFVSYDPLMTTYNVRVGRSDKPEGPFVDFFGKDLREEEDNYPILTYPYRFNNHIGWAGTAHCCVFTDKNGQFFMAHQARLRPENHMMVLHVRDMYWTADGWPVVSPERFAAVSQRSISESDLIGDWEIIEIKGNVPSRDLEAGQILWGENKLRDDEEDDSVVFTINKDLSLSGNLSGMCKFDVNNTMEINTSGSTYNVHLFMGQDWENQSQTILFTGLNSKGHSIWGKKIK